MELINMDFLFPTLFSKTFFVLGCQLLITFLTARAVTVFGMHLIDSLTTESKLPLQLSIVLVVILNVVAFIKLLSWGIHQPLHISFWVFSIWSILTGIILEYFLLHVEEGIGSKILALTGVITLGAALIGIYTHIDFGFLQLPLFIALIIIMLGGLAFITTSMNSVPHRVLAGFSSLVFSLYLLVDFHWLSARKAIGLNSWDEAMNCAINIYLDIINLFINLLALLGNFTD